MRAVPSAQVSPGAGWIGAAAADRGSPVRVETDLFIAEFDRIGADLLSWKLKTYTTLDGSLVEVVELPNHPWFVGCQFHPEFTSTPRDGHPLFAGFVEAANDFHEATASEPAMAGD